MNDLVSFTFDDHPIFVRVDEHGEPWWAGVEAAEALGYANPWQALAKLDDDEKALYLVETPGGRQETTFINEPGLYSLIIRSRRPKAKAFKRWITHEVLPAIRKTGKYDLPKPALQLTPLDEQELLERRYDFLVRLGMADDRDRLMFADAIRTSMTTLLPQHAESLQAKGFFVSERVVQLGYHLTRKQEAAFITKLGRQIAEEYRSRYGCEPRASSRFVDGAVRSVKWYAADDASWIDTIIQSFFAGFPGIEREEYRDHA